MQCDSRRHSALPDRGLGIKRFACCASLRLDKQSLFDALYTQMCATYKMIRFKSAKDLGAAMFRFHWPAEAGGAAVAACQEIGISCSG